MFDESSIRTEKITTNTNISTRINIYATDGLIKKSLQLQLWQKSITTPMVKNIYLEYSDWTGLDKLTIKSSTDLKFRNTNKVKIFSADGTIWCNMWMKKEWKTLIVHVAMILQHLML